jgi:VWFA-related protein
MKNVRTLSALGLVCFVAAVAAQAPPGQPLPRFQGGIDVIQIEVSVLDQDRRAVRGLRPADFTVLQDGRPQQIVGFHEISIPDIEVPAPAWARDIAPEVQTNRVPQGRLIVLLLDDAMEPGLFVESTKTIARDIVARLGPEDRAAVVFTRDNRNAQDFTADRARLLAAIERFSTGFVFAHRLKDDDGRTNPAVRGDDTYYRYSIDTIGEIAKSLADVPHRRKVLVYVGIGVPLSVEDATTAPVIGSEEGTSADLQGSALQSIGALGQALRQARMSNVSVYSIDSAGLGGLDGYASTRPGFMPPPQQMRDYLFAIAANTGGRAAVEVNDVTPAIERVFSENNAYYLIGYRATTPRDDEKFRRLEVKVSRPGVTVRARSGFEPPKRSKKNAPPPSPLAKALAGVLPDEGIAMQVTAAPFATGGKTAALAIVAALHHPVANPGAVHQIELVTTAFTPEGQPRGSVRQTARLTLRPDANSDAEYEVLSQIRLKPGRYSLRMAAHNPTIVRSGSVFYDVTVPDFEKEALSLSGALVSATPQLPSAPKNALTAITPIVPTTRRNFVSGDTAVATMRIYQRGARERLPVTITARIVDTRESVVFTSSEVVAAGRFPADRSADYGFSIPLDRLRPGSYLLTFEAVAGQHTARRDIRLTKR